MQLIGDVKGKTCIIVDDMIDTAGTLTQAAALLKEQGASKVYAFATHGIFSEKAAEGITYFEASVRALGKRSWVIKSLIFLN